MLIPDKVSVFVVVLKCCVNVLEITTAGSFREVLYAEEANLCWGFSYIMRQKNKLQKINFNRNRKEI